MGWRWTSEGVHCELTWLRGTTTLLIGHSVDGVHCHVATVDRPDDLPGAPTLEAARIAALHFIAMDATN